MHRNFRISVALPIALAVAAMGAAAHAQQAPSDPIAVRAITNLAPADRLVSGDWVIYTLEVRNTASTAVHTPTVTYPVPQHMSYVAESAVGPGTEISYSVDGGRSFDAPENLKVRDPDGQARPASAADYTHIRWELKNALKGNSVAFVRFRARVK
jgi:uncharacterized repeat protein (TIGR01451 family)